MRFTLIPFLFSILLFGLLNAQPPGNRYNSDLFANLTETQNVLFSSNVPQPKPGGGFYETLTGFPINVKEYDTENVNLRMNIFQPTDDTLTMRPLIIIAFGGGFVDGSKDHWSMRLLAQNLAKRGYVTALIDYRLGMNIFDEDLSKRAVYRGVQDGRSAVRFFKADAAGTNIYKVDPNNIYIGGHSSGAFIATHNAYLDKESERPLSTFMTSQSCGFLGLSNCTCPNLLCLDCVGNNTSHNGSAKAVFSLAGAIGEMGFMETDIDPKIVMFHSSDDGTVPYNSGQPFNDLSWAVVGFDLPVVYGSNQMNIRANTLGMTKQFYPYTTRGHSVHETSSAALYTDIVPGISDFFFLELLKPIGHTISGPLFVCSSATTRTYTTASGNAKYYQWTAIGGAIVSPDPSQPSVTVNWDTNAPTKSLTLTPYSKLDAKGDPATITISVQSSFTNTWIGGAGNWINESNWSMSMVPEGCHNVSIPAQANNTQIEVPTGTISEIRSMMSGYNVNVILEGNAHFTVKQ